MKLTDSKNVIFHANAKDVIGAFSKVKGIVSYVKADDGKFVIATTKEGAFAIGVSTDAIACVKIEAEVISHGVIGVDCDLLCGVIKNRTNLQFEASGKLKIKEAKGRYNSQIEILNFDDKDISLLQHYLTPTKSRSLSSAQIAVIRAGVKQVELQDFYGDSVLLALIDVKEQGIVVTCYDNYHAAQYTKRIDSEIKMRMALPTKAFALIDKIVAANKAKFETANGRLRIAGPDFLVCIPESQVDSEAFDLFTIYKKSLKNPVTQFVFDTNAVSSVENMFALVDVKIYESFLLLILLFHILNLNIHL